MENVTQLAAHVRAEMSKVVVGQTQVLDQMLAVLLCNGHALLEGAPGVAKTLAVKTLACLCRLQFQRIQCTPDLMPADVLGGNIFNMAAGAFALHKGPVFTDLLLVDEINRTPPRTQAALLEAMEERQVTIDGAAYPLPGFFTVFATQNPVEFEGTYPLPEAQLDRFLMKVRVAYPSADDEVAILNAHHQGFNPHRLQEMGLAPVETSLLEAARGETARVCVEPALMQYVSAIARRTRDWPALSLGASPRAAVSLMNVAKAYAAIEDRDYMIPDDVKAAAPPVLRHRLLLRPEADLEGQTADQVIAEILRAVEVPK